MSPQQWVNCSQHANVEVRRKSQLFVLGLLHFYSCEAADEVLEIKVGSSAIAVHALNH